MTAGDKFKIRRKARLLPALLILCFATTADLRARAAEELKGSKALSKSPAQNKAGGGLSHGKPGAGRAQNRAGADGSAASRAHNPAAERQPVAGLSGKPRRGRTQRFLKMKDRLLFRKPRRKAPPPVEAGPAAPAEDGETASSKTQKPSKPQKTGVRILKVKKGGLFFKLSLKEKDIISKLNGKPVRNRQSFAERLETKAASSFQLTVLRKGRPLILSYKTSDKSGRRDYQLISSREKNNPEKKSPAPPPKKPPASAKPAKQKTANPKPVKQKSVKKQQVSLLKKHKRLLQKGYVLHPGGGIIYDKPSFDSQQMFVVPFGKEAVISKKILRPEQEIGSFYKIFIQEPKKTAGYISEIDILPQYIKKQGAFVLNPEYGLWKKSANKDAFAQNRPLGKNNSPTRPAGEAAAAPGGRAGPRPARLFGPAFGASLSSEASFKERLRFGLQLSGHDLLIPRLNADIRFLFDSKWDDLSVEVTANALFLNAGAFKAGPAGGLSSHVQFQNQEIKLDGAAGFSGLLPLAESLILRGDLLWTGFFHKPKSVYFLSAFQWRF